MSSKPPTADGDQEGVPITGQASERSAPNDEAAELEALAEPKGVPSPELIARLKQLNDADEAAFAGKASPWANGGGAAGIDRAALPSAARPSEAAGEEQAAPASRTPALPVRRILAAVAAVLVPVIVTIVVMRRDAAKQPRAAPVVEAVGSGTPESAGTATAGARAMASADAGADASATPEIKLPRRSPKAAGSSSAAVPAVTATASAAPTVSPDLLQ